MEFLLRMRRLAFREAAGMNFPLSSGAAVVIFFLLCFPEGRGDGRSKQPEEIDLEELSSVTAVITFRGVIALDGETH